MDKENLFYVVEKGTNKRLLNSSTWSGNEPFVGEKENAKKEARWMNKMLDGTHAIISIQTYENLFLELEESE